MVVLKRGNRLSITPVTADEWNFISRYARERSSARRRTTVRRGRVWKFRDDTLAFLFFIL
jgi:hypothetical protein